MPRTLLSFPGGFLLLLLLAASAARAGELPELPSADDPIEVDSLTRAARVLTALTQGEESGVEAAAEDLAEGGKDMIPCLLALRQRFSRPEHIEATVAALVRLGAPQVEAYLHFHLGTNRDPAVRSLVYRLLVVHGTPAGTTYVIAAMRDDGLEERRLSRNALAAILGRPDSAPAYAEIEAVWRRLTPTVRAGVIAALGDADTKSSLRTLEAFLGEDSTVDPIVLSALARMETHGSDLGLTERILKDADSSSAMVRKVATTALGRLEDPAAVPRLIDLLDSPDEGLRKDAHWALRKISGMRFPASPARWRVWYEQEMNWWWTEGQKLLEDLQSADERVAVRAILLFTRRPFFRRAVEGDLIALAAGDDGKTNVVAKHALGKLGLSDDPSTDIQRAAATARLLDPAARPDVVSTRRPAPPVHIGPGGGLPLPLLIVGGLVFAWLVWRIFGRSLFARVVGMRRWIADPGEREGPVTITVERHNRA